jgi:hypothetical protein
LVVDAASGLTKYWSSCPRQRRDGAPLLAYFRTCLAGPEFCCNTYIIEGQQVSLENSRPFIIIFGYTGAIANMPFRESWGEPIECESTRQRSRFSRRAGQFGPLGNEMPRSMPLHVERERCVLAIASIHWLQDGWSSNGKKGMRFRSMPTLL